MGGSGSRPRKLTIDNNNPMSVIKVSEDVVERIRGKEAAASPVQAITEVPQGTGHQFYEPSLTSIQIRQANVKALQENDNYWDKRIEQLQQRHEQMQQVMQTEFTKALDEMTSKKLNKEPAKNQKPFCMDRRNEIIDCYKKHRNEPMRCAKEVQQFAECVDAKRASLIANRG